jgi:hypothetical protein
MMTSQQLFRLSGFVTMIGALFFAISEIIDTAGADPFSTVSALTEMLAFLLLPFGILGIYIYQKDGAGWLGLLGTTFFGLGAGLNIAVLGGALVYRSLIPRFAGAPTLFKLMSEGGLDASIVILGMVGFLAGALAFGIASWRANILPRPSSILLLIGLIAANGLLMVSPQIGHAANLVMLAGLAWMGLWVLQKA